MQVFFCWNGRSRKAVAPVVRTGPCMIRQSSSGFDLNPLIQERSFVCLWIAALGLSLRATSVRTEFVQGMGLALRVIDGNPCQRRVTVFH